MNTQPTDLHQFANEAHEAREHLDREERATQELSREVPAIGDFAPISKVTQTSIDEFIQSCVGLIDAGVVTYSDDEDDVLPDVISDVIAIVTSRAMARGITA